MGIDAPQTLASETFGNFGEPLRGRRHTHLAAGLVAKDSNHADASPGEYQHARDLYLPRSTAKMTGGSELVCDAVIASSFGGLGKWDSKQPQSTQFPTACMDSLVADEAREWNMASEDKEIAQSVAKHGWHAVDVNDASPPFVYTCGLMTTFDHPELIILGLDSREAYSVLAIMVEELRHGHSFANPGSYDGILEGRPIAVRKVHATQREMYLGYAMGHCRLMGNSGGLRARQVFWPDKQGRFPFDVGCDLDVYRLQPRLDLEVPPSERRAFRRQFRG